MTVKTETINADAGIKKTQHIHSGNPFESMTTSQWIKTFIAASVGNFMEWFDFSIFGLFAKELGYNFFPDLPCNSSIQNNCSIKLHNIHLLQSFSVFGAAFIARPFGGTFFGFIGDRFGRVNALRLSILMMAIPTFVTGCLPTYHSIGILSTILLVILRLIQGLSVGGEYAGALVYIIEISPNNKKVLYITLLNVLGCGTLVGSAIEVFLRKILTDEQILNWGWRIPFWLGLICALFGLYIRKVLKDSHEYKEKKDHHEIEKNPIIASFKRNKCMLSINFFHLSLGACSWYYLYIWMPQYLLNMRQIPINNAYTINIYCMVINSIFAVISGKLGDIFGPIKVILIFGPLYLLSVIILFPILGDINTNVGVIPFIQITFSICFGLYGGSASLFEMSIFKDTVTRYSSVGISHNVSAAIFGGTAPLIATWIVSKFGISIYRWIILAYGICSFFVVILYWFIYEPITNNKKQFEKIPDNENDKF